MTKLRENEVAPTQDAAACPKASDDELLNLSRCFRIMAIARPASCFIEAAEIVESLMTPEVRDAAAPPDGQDASDPKV